MTSRNLMDDEDCLKSTQQEMEAALNTMRVDEPTKEIKNPKTSNNTQRGPGSNNSKTKHLRLFTSCVTVFRSLFHLTNRLRLNSSI